MLGLCGQKQHGPNIGDEAQTAVNVLISQMDLCSGEQKDIALAHRRRRRGFSQRGKCRAMGKSEATRQGGVVVGTRSNGRRVWYPARGKKQR